MASYQRCPELPSGVAPDTRLYLRPVAKLARDLLAESEPLAGGPLGFDAVEAILRPPTGASTVALTSLAQLRRWAKDEGSARRDEVTRWLRQMAPRPENILDLSAERPLLMGVLNITPDSFSDGGDFLAPDVALKQANALVIAGADILDLGAESTRPGAEATAAKEQLHRLLPVLERLSDLGVPISVDPRSAAVMRVAIAAGASVINDVSGFGHDPASLAAIAETEVSVVLMHSRNAPATMQRSPRYDDVLLDVYDELAARLDVLTTAGVARNRIILDPGIGFAKSAEHNLQVLARLSLLHGLGRPLLIGLSRKSFIARISRGEAPKERLPGSLAGALWALNHGAQILRVHDVGQTWQAVQLWNRLVGNGVEAQTLAQLPRS